MTNDNISIIVKSQLEEMFLTLMEQDITEHSANFVTKLEDLKQNPTFGKSLSAYFRNVTGISEEDKADEFLLLYYLLKTGRSAQMSLTQKNILMTFAKEKQMTYIDKARTADSYEKEDGLDTGNTEMIFSRDGDILLKRVMVRPAVVRKELYDALQAKYPDLSQEALLHKIERLEYTRYLYDSLLEYTGWADGEAIAYRKDEASMALPDDWYLQTLG